MGNYGHLENRITLSIVEHLLEVESIKEALAQTLDILVSELKSESGAIWLLDKKADVLSPVYISLDGDIPDITVENGIGVEGKVTSSGKPLRLVETDPEFEGSVYGDIGFKVKSLLCVPLKLKEEPLGCMMLINKNDGEKYDDTEQSICMKAASLATMVIEEKGLSLPSHEEKKVLVELKDIMKEFRSGDEILHVLNGINLKIYEGEFVVVLGESGCGKSTMMNIIGGMDFATSGKLYIEGKDFSSPQEQELTEYRRNYIGFVFQSYNLMPNLTAKENVQFIAEIAPDPLDVQEAVDLVGLTSRADNFPAQMSGGQQQRVSIARAVVKNPKLILADEPTAALDFATGQGVLKVIEDIVNSKRTTVVMITHNVEIAKMAHRVVRLRGGRISSIRYNAHPLHAEELSW